MIASYKQITVFFLFENKAIEEGFMR